MMWGVFGLLLGMGIYETLNQKSKLLPTRDKLDVGVKNMFRAVEPSQFPPVAILNRSEVQKTSTPSFWNRPKKEVVDADLTVSDPSDSQSGKDSVNDSTQAQPEGSSENIFIPSALFSEQFLKRESVDDQILQACPWIKTARGETGSPEALPGGSEQHGYKDYASRLIRSAKDLENVSSSPNGVSHESNLLDEPPEEPPSIWDTQLVDVQHRMPRGSIVSYKLPLSSLAHEFQRKHSPHGNVKTEEEQLSRPYERTILNTHERFRVKSSSDPLVRERNLGKLKKFDVNQKETLDRSRITEEAARIASSLPSSSASEMIEMAKKIREPMLHDLEERMERERPTSYAQDGSLISTPAALNYRASKPSVNKAQRSQEISDKYGEANLDLGEKQIEEKATANKLIKEPVHDTDDMIHRTTLMGQRVKENTRVSDAPVSEHYDSGPPFTDMKQNFALSQKKTRDLLKNNPIHYEYPELSRL